MADTPRMKTTKQMYEEMLTEPSRPSLGHTTRRMEMADKMFAVEKKARGGYIKSADGCCQRGKTRGRMV